MKILILILVIFPSHIVWSQFSLGGYFENSSGISAGKDADTIFVNDSEIKFDVGYKSDNWRMISDIRLNIFYGYNGLINAQPNNFIFNSHADNGHNYAIGIDVSRLFLKINAGNGFITIGRSYLNFGQKILFNPLEWDKNFNLINPTSARSGVNMVGYDLGLGSFGKLELFIGGDDQWDTPLAGAELILGTDGFEFGTTYQYKGFDQNIFGAFFKADIVLSLFGTYALHANDILTSNVDIFHELTLGIDYSFTFGLTTLLVQQIFYYNSLGSTTTAELIDIGVGDYYFRGEAYSYSIFTWTISQFTSLGTDVLVNLHDGSGAVFPNGRFILVDGLTLDFRMGIFYGQNGGEFSPNQVVLGNISPNVNLLMRLRASF